MAKAKKAKKPVKKATRVVSKKKPLVEYNSLTFLLFLAFILAMSLLLVAKII